MKKSLLALAVLGAFTGIAAAQSSVTLFGVVDQSFNNINNAGHTVRQMASNQLNSNRLGFKGSEDLGGGLSAGFWLEGAMSTENGNAGGLTFQRRSTVSLVGTFGEIRLGRDYTPSFWNSVFGDVNGANGLGEGLNLFSFNLGSNAATFVRANNQVSYFLPGGLGGFYGQVSVAAGSNQHSAKYEGGRIGYGAGPIDVSVAYSQTTPQTNNKFDVFNVGGSYNFGIATVYGFYYQDKWGNAKQSVYELSVGVPVGPGQLRGSYGHTKLTGTNDLGTVYDGSSANMFGVEYVYDLSKMTSVYVSYGHISNTGAQAGFAVEANGYAATNNTSTGENIGLRVAF